MATQFQLGSTRVQVEFKDIKNVHLSVHPPVGRVSISAPRRMKLETVRLFAISKLDWIRRQQKEILAQDREPKREYVDRESLFVWGRRCLLVIAERDEAPCVALKHNKLHFGLRPGTPAEKRHAIAEAWYREQVRLALPDLLAKWQPILGVEAIHLVLDNYKIHDSKIVQAALQGCFAGRIKLHFLPPYCPKYNRIERVWKDLHDNVTHATTPAKPSIT